jgi:type VI secretion system protein ImpL
VIGRLGSIRASLFLAANNEAQASQAMSELPGQITELRTSAARLPPVLAKIFVEAANKIEEQVSNEIIGQLSQSFDAQVTQRCERTISNRYPFQLKSDRDVPLRDFAELFGPNGVIDGFFTQNLASLVDTTKRPWTWRTDKLAQGRSETTLRQFERAAEIRDAFFAGGGEFPSISFTVTPVKLPDTAERVVLGINEARIEKTPGSTDPASVEWPGANPSNVAFIAVVGALFGEPTDPQLQKRGAWALFRLLKSGPMLKRGDGFVSTFKVENEEISYRFDVNTIDNPFLLPLAEFRCPAGL